MKAELQFKALEVLNCSVNSPIASGFSSTNFNFNINLETKADENNKLIFVIVNIEVRNEEHDQILGSLSVSCVYDVFNFDKIVRFDSNGKVELPQPLIELLNSVSISTTRGMMFSTFKGTFLHNALLPIVDPIQ